MQQFISRFVDLENGKPRDPAYWLVLAAVVATQVLAIYAVCESQVRKAEDRAQAEQVHRVALADCWRLQTLSDASRCSSLLTASARGWANGNSPIHAIVPVTYAIR